MFLMVGINQPFRQHLLGASQGVGGIDGIPKVADCVARMEREYHQTWARMSMLRPA